MAVEIIIAVVAFAAGWLLTHIYYRNSAADLKKELAPLKSQLDALVALALKGEQAGVVKLERNSVGDVIGGTVVTPPTGQLTVVGHPPTVIQGKSGD